MPRVLVADDEENIRLVLRTLLRKHGYEVEVVDAAESALDRLEDFDPDFVIADVRMPGMSGIDLCHALRDRKSRATVIVMSAYGSTDLALEAMKAGAYDYVGKPFKQDEMLLALRKAEEREALRRENRALKEAAQKEARFGKMIGRSVAMQRLFRLIEKVADYKSTVLIRGESGTGKELVARALHEKSSRAPKSFVAINCAAIPDNLLESELFGHRRGAFTDAHQDKRGLFEEAHGGTLFLDEIGELPLALQVKLLRVLQEGSFRPLGGTKDKEVDVRVVTATLRDLDADVKAGRFREDLYYRLHVLEIIVPPLRERREDVPLLVDHFVARNAARLGTRVQRVAPAAMKLLLENSWPGNVRELENAIERSVVLAEGDELTPDDLPASFGASANTADAALAGGELSIKKTVRYIEETLIRRALAKTGGNRTAASKVLEISHRALLYKIKDYGIA
jgi:two-component system response regulator AtoC